MAETTTDTITDSTSNTDTYQPLPSGNRHYKRKMSAHTRKRVILLSVAIAILVLILIVVSVYSSVTLSALRDKKKTLEEQIYEQEQIINDLRPKLKNAKAELGELVQGRFPNLMPLEVDQVIELDHPHYRNVVFTVIKTGNEKLYEYKLLIENVDIDRYKPSFRVLLFDRFGVHIGIASVKDVNLLPVGETRSYSGSIEFMMDNDPKHFFVDELPAE